MNSGPKLRQYEAIWWEERGPEKHRGFADLEEARAWLRGQATLEEWLIRQRSPHGWRAVDSGTFDRLHETVQR